VDCAGAPPGLRPCRPTKCSGGENVSELIMVGRVVRSFRAPVGPSSTSPTTGSPGVPHGHTTRATPRTASCCSWTGTPRAPSLEEATSGPPAATRSVGSSRDQGTASASLCAARQPTRLAPTWAPGRRRDHTRPGRWRQRRHRPTEVSATADHPARPLRDEPSVCGLFGFHGGVSWLRSDQLGLLR
jgi:hypothetical protein